jgi:hypothetical protein
MIIFKQKIFAKTFEEFLRDRRMDKQRLNNKSLLSSVSAVIPKSLKTKIVNYYNDHIFIQEHPDIDSEDDWVNKSVEKIKNNDPWAVALFQANDTRQGIHQTAQIDFLKETLKTLFDNKYKNPICEISLVPAGSLYCNNGTMGKIKGLSNGIDGKIIYSFKNEFCYIYLNLKYIRQAGHAQDNQIDNAESIIKDFIKIKDIDIYSLTIIDGNYGVKKSETLKKYNTEKNWVTNSDNAAKQVVVFISNWLLKKFPEPENAEEVENEIRRLNKLL